MSTLGRCHRISSTHAHNIVVSRCSECSNPCLASSAQQGMCQKCWDAAQRDFGEWCRQVDAKLEQSGFEPVPEPDALDLIGA